MDFLYHHHYLAVIHDQRGHGQTGKDSGDLGFFSNGNGWERVVSDVKEISGMLSHAMNDQHNTLWFGRAGGFVISQLRLIGCVKTIGS